MKYSEVIISKAQAFCHLLLYFSLYEDETFEGEETFQVFSILQMYPFTQNADFPEDVNLFFDYKKEIDSERNYFDFLVRFINSEAPVLILFHAAQVAMSDTVYSEKDEASLVVLSEVLGIEAGAAKTVIQLALEQRRLQVKGDF